MPREGTRCFYHFSPARHRTRILQRGLDPRCDRRGKGRIWLCDFMRLAWAKAHVAERHGIEAATLDLWVVMLTSDTVSERRPGVYFAREKLRVSLIAPAGLLNQE